MESSPENTGDSINVDSDENTGQNNNLAILEIQPAEILGLMLKAMNETKGIDVHFHVDRQHFKQRQLLAGMKAAEEMAERMAKGQCQKKYKWNPTFYKAENYAAQKQACPPPPKRAHLEIQSKGKIRFKIRTILSKFVIIFVFEKR